VGGDCRRPARRHRHGVEVEIGNLADLEIISDLLTTDTVKVRPRPVPAW